MARTSPIFLMGVLVIWAALAEAEYMIYKDAEKPLSSRIKDLMSRMTLEEKIGQMTQIERNVASAKVMKDYFIGSVLSGGGSVPSKQASAEAWINMVNEFQKGALSTRLGIPMIYGIDAVHGHNNVYNATIFPHNVGLGATRDPELVKRIGAATALEVRATGIPYVFAPCIAVCRDPRWGRCYESYSEDPKLVQAMTEIIPGLQGDIPANSSKGVPFVAGKTKVAACAKHYLGDGGTTDGINENNTQLSRQDLLNTHMPAYYNSISKGVSTIMVSYSSWNGVKMHANRDMITGFLKNILRFRGFVISDWEGIDRITSPPHANYSYSIQAGISAGIDMIMVPNNYKEFIGRLKLSSSQFVRRGEEALIYYPLEKKYMLSFIQGEIGLKIYYQDEVIPPPPRPQPAAAQEEEAKADTKQESPPPQPAEEAAVTAESEALQPAEAQKSDAEAGATTEPNKEQPAEEAESNEESPAQAEAEAPAAAAPPPDNAPAPESDVAPSPPPQGPSGQNKEDPSPTSTAVNEPVQEDGDDIDLMLPSSKWGPAPPEIMAASTGSFPDIQVSGMNAPRPIIRPVAPTSNYTLEPQESISIERSAFDLVEKMHYLFVRVVKARHLPTSGNPVVRIEVSNSRVQSKPARKTSCFEWDQTFAFGRDAPDSSSVVEISVWDPHAPNSSQIAAAANFLGGICFDVTEIPLRDPPDSPLAPQWYRLEGGGAYRSDLMLATWVGTQADESFPDAWKTDTAGNINSRAKVYQSPKLWYLRATVIEAQDIFPLTPLKETAVQVKAQLGFQVQKTKTSVSRNGTPSWNEDLLFVEAEPSSDQLIFTLENRLPKGLVTVGMVRIPLKVIERRVDDRKVASRWFSLEDPKSEKVGYRGRVHLRLCFDGGYHVMDEAAHMISDYRPTARQLWKQPVGAFELGIIGCKNLSPMKTVDGKGCTDAYCVAKYGPKWVRTRTVCDSLDPKWNEQYTWKVYDPCTVLTIGVFDSSGVYEIDDDKSATRPHFRIGKVRVRISTLETGKVYRNRYPLILLTNNGVKKMGEIEVAVKFVRATPTLDFLHVYTQPLLPLMHHMKPLGVVQQELLRNTAAKIIATHLSRSEPSLRREVVFYMLDVDSHAFSMRKIRANWIRIINVIAGVIDIVRWIDDTRVWKNPMSTILVHALLIILVWFPDLIVPTLAFYMFVIGAWNYRFRSREPLPHFDPKLSLADTVDRDELDEEFDTVSSSRPPEMVRARYDKLRMLGARVQTVLGDFATQGERLQAMVTWRDPRATGIFVGLCFVVAMVLYMVPSKMVAMASGFYFFRHPIFRDRMPSPAVNFFRRLPSLSDRMM